MAIQMPTNQRDQLMVVGCIASIALVVLYYMYLWSPRQEELTAVETRIESLVALNETARREISRGSADRIRAEAEEYGRTLDLMRQLVPTANEVPTLIDNVSTAARRVGLDLGPMEPLGVVTGDVFDTHKWRMSVTGPYHRVAQFLTNVGSLTRIVAPMNLTLMPTARQVAGRAGEQMLDANFEIQTYVAKTAAPVAGASP